MMYLRTIFDVAVYDLLLGNISSYATIYNSNIKYPSPNLQIQV